VKKEEIELKIKVNISMWSILKFRLMGLHKVGKLSRAEKIDIFLNQVGGEEE